MNKDIKLLVENIFQREGARELLKRSKAEELDAQIRKMYLYHPKTKEELENNIIECFENETDLNMIDVSEINDFNLLFYHISRRNNDCLNTDKSANIDISGWYINSNATVKAMFKYAKTIKEVILPINLQKIEKNMFEDCKLLTSVTISNSVYTIEDFAFCSCSMLTNINIPDSVKSIGKYAFYGCIGLKSVTIGNSVETIGFEAFFNCTAMSELFVNIKHPNDNTIDDYVFSYVYCPDVLLTVPTSSFNEYKKHPIWKKFNVNGTGSDYGNVGDIFCYEDIWYEITDTNENTVSVCCGPSNALYRQMPTITIPSNVENRNNNYKVNAINGYAFNGCINLKNVIIPNTVSLIGLGAFQACRLLTSITIPASVKEIGSDAFSGCSKLQTVYVDNIEEFIRKFSKKIPKRVIFKQRETYISYKKYLNQ